MRVNKPHLKMTLMLLDLSEWQGHSIFTQLLKGEGIGNPESVIVMLGLRCQPSTKGCLRNCSVVCLWP